jgi:hypothetical protein
MHRNKMVLTMTTGFSVTVRCNNTNNNAKEHSDRRIYGVWETGQTVTWADTCSALTLQLRAKWREHGTRVQQ